MVTICNLSKTFTLTEGDELIPLLEKITVKCEQRVQKLMDDQRYFLKTGAPGERIVIADKEVGRILTEWGTKLTKLGCKPFGMGFVGLDSGFGFWSWRQGETKIEYYHDYKDSPLQRRKLTRNP